MKYFVTIVILSLGVAKLTEAGRPVSTEVVQKLKELEPVYKQLQDNVINAVAGAKLNTASRTDTFYKSIIADKEVSLNQAIQLEDYLIYQLERQSSLVDTSCLQLVRSSSELNMNIAGVGFTNCVNNVEKGIDAELEKVYQLLQVDENEIFDISLLDSFRGENIFLDPSKIISKLNDKKNEIDSISLSFVADINAAVDAYASRLGDLQNGYKSCLLGNEAVIKQAFEVSKFQLTQTCLGTIVQ
ncbi:uncharacterized protein LOC128726933 [Anopheles nili]|uniref:uncharacterized protein LOC128726820 n=1 Tax=Anopheles nili TaxID=185578 RepID=UPI00237C3B39|nr:uncharacterized protein LOC128726820 [Anopheles nili]XP_053676757.1 uncharacterized protein LOC128726933 [Anopheles nili]